MYMIDKKKKILIILISCILSVVAVGGLATVFLLNYNPYVPDGVEVVQNDEQTFLIVKANTSYVGYRFILEEGENKISIDCENNVLTLDKCLTNGVELGKTYKVKFCYLSKTEGNNSQYSAEIEWRAETQLKAPVVSYLQDENSLAWENIANADYYMVYYNGENGIASVRVEKINGTNKFSLNSIPLGERSFYVVAFSNKDYIKSSKSSNVIEKTLIRQMQGFQEVSFDSESKILTLKSTEDLSKIFVYVGDESYECEFAKSQEGNLYVYKKDISIIYEEGKQIGAKPADIDRYNVYSGEICF